MKWMGKDEEKQQLNSQKLWKRIWELPTLKIKEEKK